MNAIDFKQLRRQERKQARHQSCHLHHEDKTTNVCIAATHINLDTSEEFASTTAIDPFPTLLSHNTLTNEHRIHPSLDSIYYVRHFMKDETCAEIWNWLRSIPECVGTIGSSEKRSGGGKVSIGKEGERDGSQRHNGRWTRLRHAKRKVALFDGTLPHRPLPPILLRLSQTLAAIGAFSPPHSTPNHVLINEYQPDEGIMAHTDGPAYESCTATISLGGDVIFKISPRRNSSNGYSNEIQGVRPLQVVLHGCGSLIVFRNDAYLNHCHEITENVLEETTGVDGVCGNDPSGGTVVRRGYRVSLTFRCKKST